MEKFLEFKKEISGLYSCEKVAKQQLNTAFKIYCFLELKNSDDVDKAKKAIQESYKRNPEMLELDRFIDAYTTFNKNEDREYIISGIVNNLKNNQIAKSSYTNMEVFQKIKTYFKIKK